MAGADIANKTNYLSYNNSGAFSLQEYSNTETVFVVVVMAVIFLIALAGNTLTIIVISRVPSLQTPTNLLILNLSIADIFVATFFVLFTTIDIYISQEWVFGTFLCKLVPFFQLTAARVSILSLALISVERYFTMCKPKHRRFSLKKIKTFIALLWFIGMASASPVLIVKKITLRYGKHYCAETGWTFEEAKIYTTVNFVIMYLLPILTMSFTYINIGITVWRSSNATKSQRAGHVKSTKQKITKLSLVLVISFVVSWAPVHFVSLNIFWGTLIHNLPKNTTYLLFPIFTGLAASNCALNPILYALMSINFRRALADFLNQVCSNSCSARRTFKKMTYRDQQGKCLINIGTSAVPLQQLASFVSSV